MCARPGKPSTGLLGAGAAYCVRSLTRCLSSHWLASPRISGVSSWPQSNSSIRLQSCPCGTAATHLILTILRRSKDTFVPVTHSLVPVIRIPELKHGLSDWMRRLDFR